MSSVPWDSWQDPLKNTPRSHVTSVSSCQIGYRWRPCWSKLSRLKHIKKQPATCPRLTLGWQEKQHFVRSWTKWSGDAMNYYHKTIQRMYTKNNLILYLAISTLVTRFESKSSFLRECRGNSYSWSWLLFFSSSFRLRVFLTQSAVSERARNW